MKAIEFDGSVAPNGQIAVPPEIADQIPAGEPLHVVVQWDGEATEDESWRGQGRRRFEAAYAPEDSVYDQLMNEAR
jgi:hypothetical protein